MNKSKEEAQELGKTLLKMICQGLLLNKGMERINTFTTKDMTDMTDAKEITEAAIMIIEITAAEIIIGMKDMIADLVPETIEIIIVQIGVKEAEGLLTKLMLMESTSNKNTAGMNG